VLSRGGRLGCVRDGQTAMAAKPHSLCERLTASCAGTGGDLARDGRTRLLFRTPRQSLNGFHDSRDRFGTRLRPVQVRREPMEELVDLGVVAQVSALIGSRIWGLWHLWIQGTLTSGHCRSVVNSRGQ
jgi:hypothetical protein